MPAIPFARFRSELLALYAPPLRRKATRDKVRQALDELGPLVKTTAQLGPAAIGEWVTKHAAAGRRPATTLSLLKTIRLICRYARMQGYSQVDPFEWRAPSQWVEADTLDDAPEGVPFDRHLTAADVCCVLKRADLEAGCGVWDAGRLQALVYTLAFTGMRKREVLGLAHKDLDLAEGIIRIRPNRRRGLKTRASAQPLAMAAPLRGVLDLWLPRTGCEWVFPGTRREGPWLNGGPGRRPLDQLKALGERAGIRGLTLLSFRHTFATLAEGWDVGELGLQRWLRHTSPQTQKHYRKADLDVIRGIAGKIQFHAFPMIGGTEHA